MKILLVKTSALGDLIHTFPAVAYLREKFPDAQIDWVVESPFAELIESHPLINQVYRINTKSWRKGKKLSDFLTFRRQLRHTPYDVVFDFQGNLKSGLITAQAKAKDKVGFGWNSVPEKPNLLFTNCHSDPPKGLNIRQDYLSLAQNYFQDNTHFTDKKIQLQTTDEQKEKVKQLVSTTTHPKIMVCPGSAWPNKQMTTKALIRFLEFISQQTNGFFFLVWGSEEEKIKAQQLQNALINSTLVEKLPVSVLQNLMDQMDLVISMDSLPLHLAGTTSTATFSIFGPSSAKKYQPIGSKHRSFQGSCPYGQSFEKRCPILRTCKTGACIHSLDIQKLFHSFIDINH